jgi:hypothetical protein
MDDQPDNRPLASVEADLFGVLFAFHKKTMTLLRESTLGDEKLKAVSDRIKALIDDTTADMRATRQANVAERLEAAYQEAKRLVEAMSQAEHENKAEKAKPKARRLKGRKNKR